MLLLRGLLAERLNAKISKNSPIPFVIEHRLCRSEADGIRLKYPVGALKSRFKGS